METPEEVERAFIEERKEDIINGIKDSKPLLLVAAMFQELPLSKQGELNSEILKLYKTFTVFRDVDNIRKNKEFIRRIYGKE